MSRPFTFGTDGWRGIIADDFTFPAVRTVADAIGRYFAGEQPGGRFYVGHDTRFQSDAFAQQVAAVLARHGFEVALTPGPAPSPLVSYTVHANGLRAGVMVTASHNPARWNGIKVKAPFGGSAPPEVTAQIAALANERRDTPPWPDALDASTIPTWDASATYLSRLGGLVDAERLKSARLRILCDAMHGAGAGFLDRLLADLGCAVTLVRGEANPSFGGVNPEPIAANLGASLPLTRGDDFDAGFALDGDADRLGVLAHGEFVNPHRVLALLTVHLVEHRGWTGELARTVSTTQMLDRLGERFGLPVHETPVGFKHIAQLMLDRPIILGGEESGGIGVGRHIPERDALYAALLFAEMLAVSGQTVAQRLAHLWNLLGATYYFRRVDLAVSDAQRDRLIERLHAHPPTRIGSHPLARVDQRDGTKCYLERGGWVLIRPSGTEPTVRTYAEATDPAVVEDLLAAAIALVRTAEESARTTTNA